MDAIALGCLTALVVSRIQVSPRLLAAIGAVLLIFTLCISLNMTILAVGTCLICAATARTEWTSPRLLRPLLNLGQRSYEVYLTHMFIVFAFFQLFLMAGKPMAAVPLFFIATILISGLVGEAVARLYSEPLNRRLRKRAP